MPHSMKVYPQAMDRATQAEKRDGYEVWVVRPRIIAAVIDSGPSWADWAAYEYEPDPQSSAEVNTQLCIDQGDKLPEAVARFFFRGVDAPYRG